MTRRPVTPFIARGGQKREREQHRLPKVHEEETSVALGGRGTKASGALEGDKGDVSVVGELDFLVECKSTVRKSLSIKGAWLNKVTTEAGPLRVPLIAVRFLPKVLEEMARARWAKTRQRVETAEADWIMIPRSAFLNILSIIGADDVDIEVGDEG